MKIFLVFIYCCIGNFLFSQIKSIKYDFSFPSSYSEIKTKEINYFINSDVKFIELVQLIPYCEKIDSTFSDSLQKYIVRKSDCFNESILEINDKLNVFERVSKIDETHIGVRKKLQKKDFRLLFKSIFGGEKPTILNVCYNPRHGLYFYNNKKQFLGFLEICFECGTIDYTVGIPGEIEISEKEFKILKDLFKKYSLIE